MGTARAWGDRSLTAHRGNTVDELRSLTRREDRALEKTSLGRTVCLELLEPRVLFSADALPLEPPAPVESSLGLSAIDADLDHAQRLPSHDSSVLLTYSLSSDDRGALAPEATLSEDAAADRLEDDYLGQTVQSLDADSPARRRCRAGRQNSISQSEETPLPTRATPHPICRGCDWSIRMRRISPSL